jgi:hypothetical protein
MMGILTGCVKRVRSTVPAFAHAAELTSSNVQSALQTVETNYADANSFSYAVTYDGNWDPHNIPTTWLTSESMNIRLQILQGLKQYASELSSLTGSNDVDSLNKASTAVGQSLKGLTGTAAFQKLSMAKSLPANFSEISSTSVNALSNWLIELKLKKNLPAEIEKMEPTVQSVCALLVADIGDLDAENRNPFDGTGIRQVVWITYNKRITAENQYILHNQCTDKKTTDCLSGNDRFAEIEKLPALVQQQRAADLTLQQVQTTVKQLAAAHTELVKAAQSKQDLKAELEDLVGEAERLNTYYQSLSSSK